MANWSRDVTHQVSSEYQARKILDLSNLPPAVWEKVRAVRLSAKLCIWDYSSQQLPAANGLDEAVQFVVNGHIHEYPTDAGFPLYGQAGSGMAWHDLSIPKSDLVLGANEILIRKAPGKRNNPQATSDDYLYLAIDLTRKRGNSSVTFDGKSWTQEKLTIPGGNGEYLVRLYLLTGAPTVRATWRPTSLPPRPAR